MSGYHQRIQGTDRLLRIRRMRNAVYVALVLLMVLLMYARALSEGASLKPFYLPLDGVLEVGLIMALVGTVLGIYLKNLETRQAALDSQRYLLSKYAMSRSMTTALVALAFGALLVLPLTASTLSGAVTGSAQYIPISPNSSTIVTFTTPDPFGATSVRSVHVQVSTGRVQVSLQLNGQTVQNGSVSSGQTLDLPVDSKGLMAPGDWRVVFTSQAGAALSYTLPETVMPGLFSTVPFLFFLLAAANLGSWFGLRPIRDRAKADALYAGGSTAVQIDMGERAYLEYAMQAPPVDYPTRAAIDVPPPPEPVPPPPPAVPAAAMEAPVPTPAVPVPRGVAPSAAPAAPTAAKSEAVPPPTVAAFDEALRKDPNSVPLLTSRAAALLAAGHAPDALDTYRRILGIDPANPGALRGSMDILVPQRRWREALEVTDRFLLRRPNDVRTLELRGDVLVNLGRRAEALGAYEAAQALDPQNGNLKQKIEEVRVDVPGLLSRALIASASGNYAQALNLFDDILEVEPSNVNALIGKAVAYRRSGKLNEALNCLDLVLNFQPANASALLNRGNLLVESGDLDDALAAYEKLLSISPEDEEAWAALGSVFLKMGQHDEALHALQQALRLSPGDEELQERVRELETSKPAPPDIVHELYTVKGVGPARAKALVEAGFRTMEDFQNATVEQFLAVKGITRRIAEDLVRHFKPAVLVSTS